MQIVPKPAVSSLKRNFNPALWLLAALLLLPLMLTNDSLWIDEGQTAMYALQPDFSSWRHYLMQDLNSDGQMPLSMFCAWAGAQTLGSQEWQMRAINLLWGVIAIVGLYRAGRQLQLPWLPLLLAIQPYFWFYMNEARPYALEIACGCWLLAAFVEFTRQKGAGETWAWLLAGSAFFLCLATMLAPVTIAALAVGGGCLAVKYRWRIGRKSLFVLLAGALANLPIGLYYLFKVRQGAKGAELWHVDLKFFGFVLYELTGMTGLGMPTDEIRRLARMPHLVHTLVQHWPQFVLPAVGLILLVAFLVFGLKWSPLPAEMTAGLLITLGFTALVFIGGSLLLQKAFWARHFAPVFPFYVALLGFAFAGLLRASPVAIRWSPLLLVALLVVSSLNMRFAKAWRKENYRAAAQYACRALTQNQSVWWLANNSCAIYYHLPIAPVSPEPGKAFCPVSAAGENNRPLDQIPPPDVIIMSKPDIYDPFNTVQKIIEQDHYVVADRLQSFVIWEKAAQAHSLQPH